MWIRKGLRYVFMDQATDGSGGGSGGGATGGAEGGGEGAASAGATGADGANTGGSGGGDTGGGAATTGGNALQAAGQTQTVAIPEKYQVKKEDGSLDIEASSLKLAEAYGHLEKRIGTGDLPPKSADEYKIEVPEQLKEHWKPESDEILKDFRSEAFKEGLTQKQFDFVMSKYFGIAPQLVNAGIQLNEQDCVAELQKAWPTPDQYKAETNKAYRATVGYFGEDADYIMKTYGNDPRLIRGLAKIGAEMGEDRSTNTTGGIPGGQSVESLMSSEAYNNPKHADHQRVSKQVSDYFTAQAAAQEKAGNAPIF